MKSTVDDLDDLVRRAKSGDEQAMTELITAHKALVFTIVLRMTNNYDTSQDLTQETFVKAFMNIRKVKSGDHFRPWICTIARNVVRDYLRKAKREQTVSFEQIKEYHGYSDAEGTRRRVIIQDAMTRLAERDRMLLALSYYQGLNLNEVADVMKMTESNVKVSIHRARKRLRKLLEGYEYELLSASK